MRISDWSSDVCSSDLASFMTRFLRALSSTGKLISTRRKKLRPIQRSEEHTSELQSLMRTSYDVFCLKKTHQHSQTIITQRHINKTHDRTHYTNDQHVVSIRANNTRPNDLIETR